MRKQQIVNLLSIILIINLFVSCAQVGQPMGGPQDKTPPRILKSIPENSSILFAEKKIVIEFDENIQFKDLNKQLLISPPFLEKPDVKVNMNKIVIKLNDTLQKKATYLFDFRNSVADLNEGNIFRNFSYVFSTSDVIDSMQISGKLFNAFDNEPIFDATVLVHKNLSDTAFLKSIPNYIAKTDSSGNFTLKYLSPGSYNLFALKDARFNFTYEPTTEEAAFFTEIIIPEVSRHNRVDTLKVNDLLRDTLRIYNGKLITKKVAELMPDSLRVFVSLSDSIRVDTLVRDSIANISFLKHSPDSLQLFMFNEVSNNQYIATKERKEKGKIDLIFNLDCDSLKLELIDTLKLKRWHLLEKKDPKNYIVWLTDSALFKKETIKLVAHYQSLDSLKNKVLLADTLALKFFEDPKNKSNDKKAAGLGIELNTSSDKKIEAFNLLKISFSSPIQGFNTSKIRLFELYDSVSIQDKKEKKIKAKKAIKFATLKDTISQRYYQFSFAKKEKTKYKIEIDSAAISSIFEQTNLFFESEFEFQDTAFYGTIKVNISNVDTFALVQLLNDKKEVLKQIEIESDSTIVFNNLSPKPYLLKVIKDSNKNKKWDSGNFKEKLLPERIYMYKETIETKSGWTNEIDWTLDNKIEIVKKKKKLIKD